MLVYRRQHARQQIGPQRWGNAQTISALTRDPLRLISESPDFLSNPTGSWQQVTCDRSQNDAASLSLNSGF